MTHDHVNIPACPPARSGVRLARANNLYQSGLDSETAVSPANNLEKTLYPDAARFENASLEIDLAPNNRTTSCPSTHLCYGKQAVMPPSAIDEQRVKEIIAGVYARSPNGRAIDPAAIGSGDPLYSLEGEDSLGLDSLDAVEIATELEEEFDVVMPAEIDPSELHTVAGLIEMLERLVAEQRGDRA
jgi:acyl carrier protein